MKKFWLAIILGGSLYHAEAFTLIGPPTEWQTPRLGYHLGGPPVPFGNEDVGGGPMNIGEEYRWNVPVIYYGFSPAFMDYFGQRGVEEIEKAINLIRRLPSMDAIDVNAYALDSQRINHRAQALGLRDLKSYTLSRLLNQLGLGDPTRYVFTLRNRWTTDVSTNYHVIMRNFDPLTWKHSSFINGQLWTYSTIVELEDGAVSLAITEPVDPLALAGFMNAPVTSVASMPLGGFWTDLTRDDVGGLRYIYRSQNYNMEVVSENVLAAGIGGGSPWGLPGTGVGGTNFINAGVRPGIGRLNFERVHFDSIFGFFRTNLVTYNDSVITNHLRIQQRLQRDQQAPDILFHAGDLQGGAEEDGFFVASFGTLEGAWENTSGLTVPGEENAGPGVIHPSLGQTPTLTFTYNTVGPTIWNTLLFPFINSLSEFDNSGQFFLWGSYDGSTNAPFVYPPGLTIREVERMVLEPPPGIRPVVDVWMPVQPSPVTDPNVDPGIGNGAGGGVGAGQ